MTCEKLRHKRETIKIAKGKRKAKKKVEVGRRKGKTKVRRVGSVKKESGTVAILYTVYCTG